MGCGTGLLIEVMLKRLLCSETVLEPVEVPEEKSGPSRGRLCVFVTGGAFFVGVVIAFLLNALRKVFRDPSKRRLLRGEAV